MYARNFITVRHVKPAASRRIREGYVLATGFHGDYFCNENENLAPHNDDAGLGRRLTKRIFPELGL